MSTEISKVDLANLFSAMNRIEKKGKLVGFDLIKKTANKFITSAVVATKPGRKGSISGNNLPKKGRFRKIVTMGQKKQGETGKYFYYILKSGKIFGAKKRFTPKQADLRGLVIVTKFIEAIARKTGKTYYIPIKPTKEPSNDNRRIIPKAGAAKAGWLGARRKLNIGSENMRDISNKVNTTTVMKGWNPFIKMTNNVDYITKIAPNSARIGLQKAARAMEQQFLPKAERILQKEIPR